jgi:hypothetical protein
MHTTMLRTYLITASIAAAIAPPAAAHAATYCVAKPACVAGGGIDKGSDLQAALTAAQGSPDADVVEIGATTLTGNFHYAGNTTKPVRARLTIR